MALVDDKLKFNQDLREQADKDRAAIEAFYESIDKLTDLDREERRSKLDAIELNFRESIQTIESSEWGQTISYRGGDAAQRVIYGECRVGGYVSFLEADQGESGAFLHSVITLCGHEIDQITALYLDGQKVSFNPANVDGEGKPLFGQSTDDWFPYVFLSGISRGAEDQAANSDLVAQSNILFPGKWTEDHRQRGCAHAYIWLFYGAEKFQSGPPEIAFEGRWKNKIYDPRDDSYKYTNNAVLCMMDYMVNPVFGMGFTYDQFDMDNISDGADCCDERVLKFIGDEARYTVNGDFATTKNNSHAAVLAAFERAMAGHRVRSRGGKQLIYPGKWRAPTVYFSEKDVRGPIKVKARASRRELFNGVKGKYRSAENYWEKTDYPPYKNSTYIEEHGEEIWKETDLELVTSPTTAQRVGKIELEENIQGQMIEVPMSLAGIQAQAGLNVYFSFERLGISNKAYRVESLDIYTRKTEDGPIQETKLLLKETAEGVYDWNFGEETTVDLAPNSNFPDPSIVKTPVGLDLGGGNIALKLTSGTDALYKRSDGTIFSRLLVEWAASSDPFVLSAGSHEVEFKLSSDSEWQLAGVVPGTASRLYILDVQDLQDYDVRVRAKTSSGASGYLSRTGYSVVGKSEPPETPENFAISTGQQGTLLSWDEIPDLDRDEYEVRQGASWGAGTTVYKGRATSCALSFLAAGEHNFWLRAIDTSGNYSGSSAAVAITILAPSAVGSLTGLVTHNMVRLAWTASTGTYPIQHYKILKDSVFLGISNATIFTTLEQVGGNYLYEVVAVDLAGNEGTSVATTQTVSSPPLFELLYDQDLNPTNALTLTNCIVENSKVIASIKTGETYSDHFTTNSWATPQDQINAGYPKYAQPANTTNAIYEQVVDYGSLLASALIVVQGFPVWVSGNGVVTVTISYSDDDISYTAGTPGQTQVLGVNFRYVKIKYEFDPDNDSSLVELPPVKVRLEVTSTDDEGTITANSADGSGTLISTNHTFLDVFEDSITVIYRGSSAYFASFSVSGNDVRVFLWDTSGNRVSGSVKWELSGITAA